MPYEINPNHRHLRAFNQRDSEWREECERFVRNDPGGEEIAKTCDYLSLINDIPFVGLRQSKNECLLTLKNVKWTSITIA